LLQACEKPSGRNVQNFVKSTKDKGIIAILIECLNFTSQYPEARDRVGAFWSSSPPIFRLCPLVMAQFTGRKANTIRRHLHQHGFRRHRFAKGEHVFAPRRYTAWSHPALTIDTKSDNLEGFHWNARKTGIDSGNCNLTEGELSWPNFRVTSDSGKQSDLQLTDNFHDHPFCCSIQQTEIKEQKEPFWQVQPNSWEDFEYDESAQNLVCNDPFSTEFRREEPSAEMFVNPFPCEQILL
jgi:hypothetical protein